MRTSNFFGKKVVVATFVMAIFGWGIGFYGPPIFMYTIIQKTGWSLSLCSTAVTVHFLAGALLVVKLPFFYKRVGIPVTTLFGVTILSLGVYGWSIATQPYQLFIAAIISGFGWVTMGAAAVNAIIAPWFVKKRPGALAKAYNGASVGGVIFPSIWVYMIGWFGFPNTAMGIGVISVAVISTLCFMVFRIRPEQIGQYSDGQFNEHNEPEYSSHTIALPVWTNRQFLTLAMAMSLGLFAQIGLISQLFSMLVDHIGEENAGLAMGLATISAIVGRYFSTSLISRKINRRSVACISFSCQFAGCVSLMGIMIYPALLWIGMTLFGMGIGNATSLPPIIAQSEFPRGQVHRVITLIVAISQSGYAFAPLLFGVAKSLLPVGHGELFLLVLAGSIQCFAILALFIGRNGHKTRESSQPARQ